jgi:hypothetical protein
MRELIVHVMQSYGVDEKVIERLLEHGERSYLSWALNAIIQRNEVNRSLETLSDLYEYPIHKLRYAYFSTNVLPKKDLAKMPEFSYVMTTLHLWHPKPSFWLSLAPYCFRILKRIAVEIAVAKDVPAKVIMQELNVSNGFVYRIRREQIKRELDKLKT